MGNYDQDAILELISKGILKAFSQIEGHTVTPL